MLNLSLLTAEKPLKVRIKEAQKDLAVLVLPDNQVISIHPKFLPEGFACGDQVYLNFLSKDDLDKGKKEIARAVLDEILK
jgi:hypothetical protein